MPQKRGLVILSLSTISLLILAACAAPIPAAPPAVVSATSTPPAAPTPTLPHSTSTGLRFVEFYSPL